MVGLREKDVPTPLEFASIWAFFFAQFDVYRYWASFHGPTLACSSHLWFYILALEYEFVRLVTIRSEG